MPGYLITSFGPLLPLTQFTEQMPLFNSMNFSLNMWDPQNMDDVATGMSSCGAPRDRGSSSPRA